MLIVSFRHYLFTIVFSKEDKIIIKNDYEEKGWSAYKIWKDHSLKNWTYTSVKRLLKRFKDSGIINRKEGSGRPRSVTTEKNTDLIEELICPQKEAPRTRLGPRKIAEQTGISRLSIRRMIKKKKLLSIQKGFITPEMNHGCRNRRYARAITLAQKFEGNTCMIEKTVCKMKKILPVTFLLTYKMTGYMEKKKT